MALDGVGHWLEPKDAERIALELLDASPNEDQIYCRCNETAKYMLALAERATSAQTLAPEGVINAVGTEPAKRVLNQMRKWKTTSSCFWEN